MRPDPKGLLLALALGPGLAVAAEPPPCPEPNLTVRDLAQARYQGIFEKPFRLDQGRYRDRPFVQGGGPVRTVVLQEDAVAFGDLDGDGARDAAAVLAARPEDGVTRFYLAALLDRAGEPVNVATGLLGDRAPVKWLSLGEGEIAVELVTAAEDEPSARPTRKTRARYRIEGERLVAAKTEELGPLSLTDLEGEWVLQQIDFFRRPVQPAVELTASFEDGHLGGSSGCNSYEARVHDRGAGALSIEPAATSQIRCVDPLPDVEGEFLRRLGQVSGFGFEAGRLELAYPTPDGGQGVLRFRRRAALTAAGAACPTEVIVYRPTGIPETRKPGSCFTSASGLGREDAFRCSTQEGAIFDPCFVVGPLRTVVCGANPARGEGGFVLELTKPLPPADLGRLRNPWQLELADGTLCGLLTGTRPVVGKTPANYGCADGSYLLGELRPGTPWRCTRVRLARGEEGFVVEERHSTPIRRVWR